MTTGQRIKQARLAAGLTQTKLAERIGVKYSAIHKYEAGMVVNLKRETIAALAQALNVKPSYLMCMDEEDPASEKRKELIEIINKMSDEEVDAALMIFKRKL